MRISDEHMEWATVHRMREMLVDVHQDYKVTHTYALFTTILCWVMQRIRSVRSREPDRRARAVLEALQNEQIADAPWNIWTDGDRPNEEGWRFRPHGPFPDFRGFDAGRFLLTLRNTVAHGDAHKIRPVNRAGILVGHEFRCSETGRRERWKGTIVLDRADMRRIGVEVADRFCMALSSGDRDRGPQNFEAEAQAIREDAA